MIRAAGRRSLALALALVTQAPAEAQLGPAGTQFWRLGLPGINGPLQANAQTGGALSAGDFNCDGFEDLAIGIPGFDTLGDLTDAGAVLVLYGSPSGLSTTGNQFLDQADPILFSVPEEHDGFGSALAAGDFNGDGCDELAVGVPFEDLGAGDEAITDGGIVTILLGDAAGLEPGYVFYQGWDEAGVIAGAFEAGDRFGQALVAHDFDQDGFDDLAIGVPGEDVGAVANAGAVNVVFGSAVGLNGARDRLLCRDCGDDLPGEPEAGEQLGLALAAGRLNDGAGHELAIGGPFRDLASGEVNAGSVVIVSDLAGSLPALERDATSPGVLGAAEDNAHFGAALACGDFDGDGTDELAVGIPGQGDGAPDPNDQGAVSVIDFVGGGASIYLTQGLLGPDNEEAGDQFGAALAAADFDGDGRDDLAIGVPFEDLGPLANAGMIHVVSSPTSSGLDPDTAQTSIQTVDPSDDFDQFGAAFAAGRFAGHRGADLAIGVPFEQIGGAPAAGGVNALYSRTLFADGFESGDTAAWTLTSP